METQTRTTTLYRFFNGAGELLYIGITSQGAERWNQHGKTKAWWHDVKSVTTEHYPTREAAADAERAAIKAEHPKHNVVHNSGNVTRKVASRATLLICHACGEAIKGNEGYIEVAFPMVRAFENGWSEQPAWWREWHRACDPDPSGQNVYWIGSERLTTVGDVLQFDQHLQEKTWTTSTDWNDACSRLLRRT